MSEKILIIGKRSKIAKEFLKKVKNVDVFCPVKKSWDMKNLNFKSHQIKKITSADKILLLQSIISSKKFIKRKQKEILNQISINLMSIIKICEVALEKNKNVKIIVLGSESGIKGSYDIVYGLMKTSLHKYVEERRISYPNQQLVCISPSTIIDSRLTSKRKDKKNILKSVRINPKKRGIMSIEIAELIYNIFYKTTDYLTNTVIRVDGGKFSRM
jgi:hypothetical protein